MLTHLVYCILPIFTTGSDRFLAHRVGVSIWRVASFSIPINVPIEQRVSSFAKVRASSVCSTKERIGLYVDGQVRSIQCL